MHLIIDGYEGNNSKLSNLEFIYKTLDECPNRIGMTKIMPPYVFRYVGKEPQDWGISGFVLIAESHISIHTFPERSYINIDVFSCKSFDTDMVTKYFQEIFELKELENKVIERGLDYPKDVEKAIPVLDSERYGIAQSVYS
ncbi:MAG: adenosylmethionine decarboxylase [bacterium]